MTLAIDTSLPNIHQLPNSYIIALTEYSAISLTGEEQSKYLQGQVTCDVNNTNEHSLLHGAHCDAKGKVLSIFRFINRNSAHLLIQPKASIETSLAALKKFGVFAKVDIKETTELSFYAVMGEKAHDSLQQCLGNVPDSLTPVIQSGSTTVVYIAGKEARYLLIDECESVTPLIKKIAFPIFNQQLWNLAEIREGFPTLAKESLEQYVPQMLNLQTIHGISFTKGCYLGQETVARMQYLGKNKRALFSLLSPSFETNQNDIEYSVIAGDIIEKQIGENWRKAGEVLASYISTIESDKSIYKQISIQAVLANDVDNDTVLRLKSQPHVSLSLVDLPYSHKEN